MTSPAACKCTCDDCANRSGRNRVGERSGRTLLIDTPYHPRALDRVLQAERYALLRLRSVNSVTERELSASCTVSTSTCAGRSTVVPMLSRTHAPAVLPIYNFWPATHELFEVVSTRRQQYGCIRTPDDPCVHQTTTLPHVQAQRNSAPDSDRPVFVVPFQEGTATESVRKLMARICGD